MKEFKAYLRSRSLTNRTIESYVRELNPFTDWLKIESMEAEQAGYNDLLAYMKDRTKTGISKRTLENNLIALRHFYNHLLEGDHIAINPATDLQIKGVK